MHHFPHVALYGPPGAGKTAIANAMASEFGYRRFSIKEAVYRFARLVVDRKLDRGPDYEMAMRIRKAMLDPFYGGHETFWVELLDDRIAAADWMRPIVIDDLEIEAEAEWLRDREDVRIVRVNTDVVECERRVRDWGNGIAKPEWFDVSVFDAIDSDDAIPGIGCITTNVRGLIANLSKVTSFQELRLDLGEKTA